ncbi:MAG: CbbQ/NirQ/NorQ/GpvN family protein [Chloroflexi bacterium]|nr:CbbQ/NirQ/NorQ/GpvN family protein [Chloroflexota bacterium]
MTTKTQTLYRSYIIEEYHLTEEPYYVPIGDEVELFEAAYRSKIPVLFKGPTGCGKTRFVEYMSYRLRQPMTRISQNDGATPDASSNGTLPLVTIACHEDLTASDLVGRYLLQGEETIWIDGPLTRAVKAGGICYLDEIVEARKDTTVLIPPLTDHRRILPVEKKGELLEAADGFLLVMSYNPGYQSALKDLKHSTRQRFVAIEFDYPPKETEADIVAHESGVDLETAMGLAKLGEKVRNLKEHGLAEGASTRLLIYAGKMIAGGIEPRRACQVAVNWAVTDDHSLQASVDEVINSIFE